MRIINIIVATSIALTGASQQVCAQQPPDVVASDMYFNTAMGTGALQYLTISGGGTENTASGYFALQNNTTGNQNSAFGAYALENNTIGHDNAAIGDLALPYNTSGVGNSAVGAGSLINNTTGFFNTGMGGASLSRNMTGSNDTAIGYSALAFITGSNNIGVGYQAGYKATTGSNNIFIGNEGLSTDVGTIKIGIESEQKSTYIAGINSSQITGAAVYVNSNGRLGVLASSERYKTAIAPMPTSSTRLQKLRPVTFHLKTEPDGALQYGLIAEEVEKIYPDLVIRDGKGEIQGVRYDELSSILLRELQDERKALATQSSQIRVMSNQLLALKTRDDAIDARLNQISTDDRLANNAK